MSAQERLEGELVEFSYQTDDGSWAVATVREGDGDDAKEHTVVGPIGHLSLGIHLQLEGYWSRHKRYGRRFKAQGYLVQDPRTLEGLVRYLGSDAVKGLGKGLAQRVVDAFGLDTLRVLESEPERLLEVDGIGPKRYEEVVSHWARERHGRELAVLLRGHGLGAAVTRRILARYGDDAMSVVSRDPYRLAAEVNGVAFTTADGIARAMGIGADDPRRARAAMHWLLQQAEGQGSCFLPLGQLQQRARELGLPESAVEGAVDRLVLERRLVLREASSRALQPVYRGVVDRREQRVAEGIAGRCGQIPAAESLVFAAEEQVGLELNEDQHRAVTAGLSQKVAIITGGPGTGKTTIVKVLMRAVGIRQETWALAAPTGRAARRLADSCEREGKTLHRLLEYSMQNRGFGRNIENQLQVDGVLVDEASMMDLALTEALLEALPPGARLILVGDADQLPSVGAGQVLRDLIDCGEVPVVSLHQVYRQAQGSGIVRNAHRILQGRPPVSAEREGDPEMRPDFFCVPRREPEPTLAALLEVVKKRLPDKGFDSLRDIQILTPMRRGPLGTRALNQTLQNELNPGGATLKRGGRQYRVGDRVIQVRNDYDNDIFNGDVGRVTKVDPVSAIVDFDGREVALVGEQLDHLELAYAISIHKSQGSEYRAVVVVLANAHFVMLRRSLLYTGVTRAKEFCCIVGSPWAVEKAVTQIGGGERFTALAARIQAYLSPR